MPLDVLRRPSSAVAPVSAETGPGLRRSWVWASLVAGVAVLAFVARLLPMLRGGGLNGADGYDDSVYYAAATALVHGRLPYDQFVLLHPPGLMLALTPFAELARLTGDATGQVIARVAFMALGAVNTVLVMQLGRRFGRAAGIVAGLTYAVSYPAMYAERTTTLEALGSFTMLVALLLLMPAGSYRALRASRSGTGRLSARRLVAERPITERLTARGLSTARLAGAGAALGLGAGVKIWGVVPLAVIVVWVLATAGWRAASRVLGAALLSVTAICLPFFAHAPAQMLRYVIGDQLGRPRMAMTTVERLTEMTGLQILLPHAPTSHLYPALVAVLLVVAVAALVALATPGARVFVALLVAQTVVLMSSPSFFLHYATLTAAPVALLLGVTAGRLRGWTRPWLPSSVSVVAVAAAAAGIVACGIPGMEHRVGLRFPAQLPAVAAATRGCITADDPTDLIDMNVLSRDLDAGCRVWVDVTGLTYDKAGGNAGPLHRTTNRVWQHQVMSYLLSGSATMTSRYETDLNHASTSVIHHLPVISRNPGFTLHSTR